MSGSPTLLISQIRTDGATQQVPRSRPEMEIEDALFAQLKSAGKHPRREFRCHAGVADIVSDDAVYEIKASLSCPDSVFKAVGQVILYRRVIDPSRRAVIVGPDPHDELCMLVEVFMGIEVLPWKK